MRWLVGDLDRLKTALIASLAVAALTLACHGSALIRGEQYAYRDAAYYYYPLHQRVQQEWAAGRWPLWDPSENAGRPLIGDPTAAVLYPGKLIFAAAPYPLAARLYIIAHDLLAFVAMVSLLRSWRTGGVGSTLGGLAYAFGAPVMFQYSNVIDLVGASWAPLGMLSADRWVRLGDRRGIPGLALVLAMEGLGGDPEVAYLTGAFAAAYAVGLAIHGRSGDRQKGRPKGRRRFITLILLAGSGWSTIVLVISARAPSWRGPVSVLGAAAPLPWMVWVGPAVAVGWAMVGWGLLARWRRAHQAGLPSFLGPKLAGLLASAILAAGLSAAQMLPAVEFVAQSARVAGEGSHEIYASSLDPIRLISLVWPNAAGTIFEGNHSWLESTHRFGKPAKDWIPSTYLGGLTLVLALAVFRLRGAPAWQPWMVGVGVFSLVASFGEFASPLAIARTLGAWTSMIGGHDPVDVPVIRPDGRLRDGDGGLYWALATFLPGFGSFRVPAKFLTFASMALACLAGRGWDTLALGDPGTRRRVVTWTSVLLALTVLAWVLAMLGGRAYPAGLAQGMRSTFGPFDVETAYRDLLAGLTHAAVVLGAVLGLLGTKLAQGRFAGAFALGLMTVDLGLANAGLVLTLPQRLFDEPPEVLEIILKAERDQPSDGPFRVYRMRNWRPLGWAKETSRGRTERFLAWERGTIRSRYGIPLGVEYTTAFGGVEIRDYEAFFRVYYSEVSPRTARMLGVSPDRKIAIYSRFAFDLWNTGYFVLPYDPIRWDDAARGFAAFLDRTDQIYPAPAAFLGEDGLRKQQEWIETADFQVRRNLAPHPRAWVVHLAVELRDEVGQSHEPADPSGIDDILFASGDPSGDPTVADRDPRSLAWLEPGRAAALRGYLDGRKPSRGEYVRIGRHSPNQVELKARLDRPGLVVLADTYYPGWTLTIDGRPAPIERANRMMRAAAVEAGEHTLVYSYRPTSFRVGLVVSCVTLAALGVYALLARRPWDGPSPGGRAYRRNAGGSPPPGQGRRRPTSGEASERHARRLAGSSPPPEGRARPHTGVRSLVVPAVAAESAEPAEESLTSHQAEVGESRSACVALGGEDGCVVGVDRCEV